MSGQVVVVNIIFFGGCDGSDSDSSFLWSTGVIFDTEQDEDKSNFLFLIEAGIYD